MDIGCYAIHSARRIFGAEPTRVRGSVEIHPEFGVDITGSGLLDFPGGQATFTVATQSDPAQRVAVVGTEGRIELSRPFNAQHDRPMVVRIGSGMGGDYGEPLEEVTFGPADQYSTMAEQFTAAVLSGAPLPVGLEDAVANMAVIDQLFASAR
jgi:predicted dehydrogenase